jgi:nitroimidazol reductase NimA-like FMN-containing flavoprotein (pyridoxamine 5'-phosphate oxidase superfamily)
MDEWSMNSPEGSAGRARSTRRLTRLPEKQHHDVEMLHALLDSTYLGHVAHLAGPVTEAEVPVGGREATVTPTAVVRLGDRLVWHGSTGSGWMRRLASGVPVAVSITALDAIVVARSRFESSFRYRSAVVRGTPVVVEGADKVRALDTLLERIVPGRVTETRESTAKELSATLVLALPLDDWVLKVSDGWPEDSQEDVAGDAWAGVVPLATSYGSPVPAPDLRPGIDIPESVRRLR